MITLPYSPEAYRLLHEGAIALSRIEHNGMRIDEAYLASAIEETEDKIREKQERITESKVMKVWRKRFRTKTNFNSSEQLGRVLYDELGYKGDKTEKGSWRTDETSLGRIDHPFVRRYLRVRKMQKGLQFLKGIRGEVQEGILHPVFSLHLTKTYRSSSEDPNFQNLPVRNEWMKNLVRRCIRARRGRRIVEVDYSQIEVRVACCYHRDPTMEKYIKDPSKDMHRDMAMECYKLPQEEVTKSIRYCAKNKFVFPEFYGSWWLDCSANLWEAIQVMGLKTESGVPLEEHLREKGIKRLGDQNRKKAEPKPGTFESHIQKVEHHFWNKRFPVYSQWKRDWYRDYLKKGWFKTKTGFICQGQMARNDAINYPVQGPAFHCLLQAMNWLVNEELDRRHMEALVIGQIHDSLVGDVPEEEVEDYIALCHELMVEKLMKAWKWIIVPLEIEAEVTPVGGSWVEKEGWKK